MRHCATRPQPLAQAGARRFVWLTNRPSDNPAEPFRKALAEAMALYRPLLDEGMALAARMGVLLCRGNADPGWFQT